MAVKLFGAIDAVESKPDVVICEVSSAYMSRKIARALNAMERPKAKPFKFDWIGIDPKYKWAAMDLDGVWAVYKYKPPSPTDDATVWPFSGNVFSFLRHPPYPGDWRDSLQKRP